MLDAHPSFSECEQNTIIYARFEKKRFSAKYTGRFLDDYGRAFGSFVAFAIPQSHAFM